MKTVSIASKNPVKIETVKLAFTQVFPEEEFEFIGADAASEVSDQPMSEIETLEGAKNRLKNIQAAAPNSDYWVSLEGGLQENNSKLEAFAYILVASKTQQGQSKTATFELPEQISELVRSGMELGKADDIVFQKSNSKQQNGAVGLLTHNVITRTEYYKQAVILALIPSINPEFY